MAIKHSKVSSAPEGSDPSKVRTSDWNADHTIEAGTITDAHIATANKDGAAGTLSLRTLGTTATSACAGNDARLSDARAPTAHNHDASYAAVAHTHTGVYSPVAHNHDGVYSPVGHSHAGTTPTGVFSDLQFSLLQAAFTLANVITAQAAFPAAQDTFTMAANSTYRVTGRYLINTGTVSHTTAMAWSTAATISSFEYTTSLSSAAANATTTAQTTCHVTGVAAKVLNAASTAARTIIEFDGIIVTTTGGSIVPQIQFSAAPGGTNQMLRGSYVSFERLGSDAVTVAGGWA